MRDGRHPQRREIHPSQRAGLYRTRRLDGRAPVSQLHRMRAERLFPAALVMHDNHRRGTDKKRRHPDSVFLFPG